MTLRSPRERMIQTLSYEICALCLAVPFYALIADRAAGSATVVMLAMMAAEMIWAPLHDTVFDLTDLRLSGRLASDRPKRWRVVHAVSREFTTMIVTLPVLMAFGGHGFWEGFWLDLSLTLMYSIYGFFFYLGFDWVRPMVPVSVPVSRPVPVAPRACYLLPPFARITATVRVVDPNESPPRAAAATARSSTVAG